LKIKLMYSSIFSCRNKIAIVTGGCGLIGREIVRGLSQYGAFVYIADRDENSAQNLLGEHVRFIYFDIASEKSVLQVTQKILNDSGKIDILINCAYPRTKDWSVKFEKISFESWKENVNNHLGGYFLCCQTIAEQMKLQQKGSIINFASTYGIVAPDFSIYEGTEMTMPAAYSAIKGGIITFTKYLATYYGKFNVRANVVSPGGILDNQPSSFVKKYSRKTPLCRMGNPEEIVGAVIYLASDASSYVTGHNLVIDGGWTAW